MRCSVKTIGYCLISAGMYFPSLGALSKHGGAGNCFGWCKAGGHMFCSPKRNVASFRKTLDTLGRLGLGFSWCCSVLPVDYPETSRTLCEVGLFSSQMKMRGIGVYCAIRGVHTPGEAQLGEAGLAGLLMLYTVAILDGCTIPWNKNQVWKGLGVTHLCDLSLCRNCENLK